jgi:hypothetical protein
MRARTRVALLITAAVVVGAAVTIVAGDENGSDPTSTEPARSSRTPASPGTQKGAGEPLATSSAPRYLEKGDLVTVAGPDGRLVRCPDGKPLRINGRSAPPPETRLPPQSVTETENSVDIEVEPVVPRCGPGGVIEWYALSEDPLR